MTGGRAQARRGVAPGGSAKPGRTMSDPNHPTWPDETRPEEPQPLDPRPEDFQAEASPEAEAASQADEGLEALILREDLAALEKKAEEREVFLNELRRARADFDNYQKRVRKDRAIWEEQAESALLRRLLPVIDDLERALQALEDGNRSDDPVAQGVRITHGAFLKVLADEGVEEIPALGELFDPNVHEAVVEEPVADRPTGEVIEVLLKGYRRRETVLRPSRVKVARNVISG